MPQWKKWASAAALAASAGGWLSPGAGAEPLKVGFIYVSPIGDAGWTFQHDSGRKEMEKALGDDPKPLQYVRCTRFRV